MGDITKRFDLENFSITPLAEDLITDFANLCHHQELPFDSASVYLQYALSRLAKKHDIKVLLDGQGADEILAGYTKYFHWYLQPDGTWWTPEPHTLAPQWRTTPLAYDWNKDDMMDLIMLDHEGYLSFFERFRRDGELWLKPGRRIFYGADYSVYAGHQIVQDSTPGPLRLNNRSFGGSGRRKIAIADWNLDGRPDLLVNSINASFLENAGTDNGRSFFRYHPPITDQVLAGHTTSPTTVDWNKDGVPELLLGAEDGHFYYLSR